MTLTSMEVILTASLAARRLRVVLGMSPLSYFQDLRVERPVHLGGGVYGICGPVIE